MKSRFLFFVLAGLVVCGHLNLNAQEEPFEVKKNGDKYRVEIDGKLFTEYITKGYNKPVLYPVIGPHGVSMTRNYPFKTVKGEATDHVHHASLWFTHGEVNGISFGITEKRRVKLFLPKWFELRVVVLLQLLQKIIGMDPTEILYAPIALPSGFLRLLKGL